MNMEIGNKDERRGLTEGSPIRQSRLRWASKAFSNPKHGGTYLFIRIAAVILLLAAVSYAVHYFNQSGSAPSVTVSSDEMPKHVALSDGSQVWMEPASTLRHPEEFAETGERVVSFRGEGTFEIADVADRPFIVKAGPVTATVLGTRFKISSAPDTIEVHVLNGNVLLTATSQKLTLESNERAIYLTMTHEFKEGGE